MYSFKKFLNINIKRIEQIGIVFDILYKYKYITSN